MKLHLPKALLAALLSGVFAVGGTASAEVSYTEGARIEMPNVININFGSDQCSAADKSGAANFGGSSYAANTWIDVPGGNGNKTFFYFGKQYTLTWNSRGTYFDNKTDLDTNSLVPAITEGYLDDNDTSAPTFTLTATDASGLGWTELRVILSGDNGKFGTINVKSTGNDGDQGTTYSYADGSLVTSGHVPWGTRNGSETLTKGTNVMVITPESAQAALTVTGSRVSSGNVTGRSTIAGAQIVLGNDLISVASGATISGLAENTTTTLSSLGAENYIIAGDLGLTIESTEETGDFAHLVIDQTLQVDGSLAISGGDLKLTVQEDSFIGRLDGTIACVDIDTGKTLSLGGDLASFSSKVTGGGTLVLSGTSEVASLNIEQGNVSITNKLASGIAAGTFQVAEGSVLSIAGDYDRDPAAFTAALDSFSGEGTLKFVDAQTDMQPEGNAFSYTVTDKKVIFDKGIVFTGTSMANEAQKFVIGSGAEVTVNGTALEARRMNVNVETGGKLIANKGILIGHGTNGNHPGWVNLNGGEIVTTFIQGQNNNNNTGADMLTAFTMTGGKLTITGENAFGLSAPAKKLKVVLQGGTIAAEASQMNLSGNTGSGNLLFTIGNVTFDTGNNHTINLNHDFTQTGTLTVTGSGTLTISGNVTVDDIGSLTAVGGYTDKTETGNGYAGNQRYLIAKGDTDGTPGFSLADSCVVTVAGENVTEQLQQGDGGLYLQTEGNDYTYYINSGNITYGDTANHNAAAETTTGLSLNGGSLTLDTGLTEQAKSGTGIVVNQAATVTINENITLDRANLTAHAATTLAGGGTYYLGTASSLGDNIALGDAWTGTVGLSMSGGTVNVSQLGKSDGSSFVKFDNGSTVGTLDSDGACIKDTTGLTVTKLNFKSGTTVFDGSTVTVTATFDMRGSGGLFTGTAQLINNSTVETRQGIWGKGSTAAILVDSTSAFKDNSLTIRGIASNLNAEIVPLESGDTVHHVNEAEHIKNAAITFEGSSGVTLSSRLSGSKVTHNGTGTLTISGDLSEGNVEMAVDGGGTMVISAASEVNTFGLLSVTGVNASLSLGNGKEYSTERFVTSVGTNDSSNHAVIEAGASLHVTGTTLSIAGEQASFMLANGGGTANLDVSGTFISDAGFSVRDGQGTINIKDGGTVLLNKGLAFVHQGNWSNGYINIESGGTLELRNTEANAPDAHLHINFANGATLAAGEESGTTTVNFNNAVVTYGTDEAPATINLSAGAGRNLTMASSISGVQGINLVGEGSKTFTETVTADSIAISGGTADFTRAVTTGTLTVGAATTMSDLTLSGAATLEAGLTVSGSTTLSGGDASITIAGGGAFTSGNETVSKLAADTNAVISGTGLVSVATASITYTNALIDVTAASDISTIAAKLTNSKVVNSNSSVDVTVSADSLADGTNDVTAAEGNITIDNVGDNGVSVKNLTVQGGNTISATTADGGGSPGTIIVEDTANVAGTVSANVTVQSGDADNKATFTANDGATVGGDLTVTATGQLEITNSDSTLAVDGILTLQAESVLNLADLAIGQKETDQTFIIARANSFSISADTIVEGLAEGLTWKLTDLAGNMLLCSSDIVGTDTPSPAMFSMRRAAAATDTPANTLTLTILGLTEKPTQLTATEVVSYDFDNKVLALNVDMEDITSLAEKNLSVTVGSEAWAAIVEAMNGEVYQNATITLNGESLGQFGTVSFNGYTGTGTQGEYFVAYIPEPATATLSLLALAALAARRRRK